MYYFHLPNISFIVSKKINHITVNLLKESIAYLMHYTMDYNNQISNSDTILKLTIDEFLARAELGKIKYGCNLDRTDLIDIQYLQHLKEELMDAVLYLNKFIQIHPRS